MNQEQGNEEMIGRSRDAEMMPSCLDGATGSTSQSSSSPYHPYARKKQPGQNVLRLLALREVAPSVKRPSRRLWGDAAASSVSYSERYREKTDAKRALISWLEGESLKHCTAKYCPLQPAPRSTIAAAFSPDGNTLASTHGDHTVKIICCRTGRCLKVLSGHRKTPWVVRFHPGSSEVLASGSFDNEVRLWDANSAECVGFQRFYRPIASLAFHARGDLLAIASEHKLYIWQYTKEADAASPVIVLNTRRSLLAVHFHPHAAPLLLTAEVNDLGSKDCPITTATSRGYLRYPAPAIHFTTATSAKQSNFQLPAWCWPGFARGTSDSQLELTLKSLSSTRNFSGLELPFLPALAQVQTHVGVGQPPTMSGPGVLQPGFPIGMVGEREARLPQQNSPRTVASATLVAMASAARLGAGNPQVGVGQGLGPHQGLAEAPGRAISIPSIGDVEAAQAAMAAAELPCTVKLRIWPHDIKRPSALLDPETCRLTIPHAVLCSEMGAHFSPCGRFLAACVACVLPPSESEHGQGLRSGNGSPGAGISVHSPTQHPNFPLQIIYELRVYSLEEATFGQVLASKAVRAAHCLTSIQFSPTSEHILLAYGRRHSSLFRNLVVIDGSQTIPIYTILEVYRVSDMELVRVLPSAEDKVNVACFHPRVGGGLVYGTKEGKLRILRHDQTPLHLKPRRAYGLEDELLEAETADPLRFGFVPEVDEPI